MLRFSAATESKEMSFAWIYLMIQQGRPEFTLRKLSIWVQLHRVILRQLFVVNVGDRTALRVGGMPRHYSHYSYGRGCCFFGYWDVEPGTGFAPCRLKIVIEILWVHMAFRSQLSIKHLIHYRIVFLLDALSMFREWRRVGMMGLLSWQRYLLSLLLLVSDCKIPWPTCIFGCTSLMWFVSSFHGCRRVWGNLAHGFVAGDDSVTLVVLVH